jgi:hypothetical protein
VIGLDALGHDVYYYEDTWSWPFDPVANSRTDSPDYSIAFIAAFFERYASRLADRWHYRHLHDQCFGLSESAFNVIASTADLYLNVSGDNPIPFGLSGNAITVFVDTDPGFNQVDWITNRSASRYEGGWSMSDYMQHQTYGENIGSADCTIPSLPIDWRTTRMPVVMDYWTTDLSPHGDSWSTVMTWNPYSTPIEYRGRQYGGKDIEFHLVECLPSATVSHFRIALGGGGPIERLRSLGWEVVDGPNNSRTPAAYGEFISHSRGEISVAKNIYVSMKTGWFSCRSACYLASARPVVVQDTGFSKFLPTGEGLFAFSTTDEAVAAIEAVESDYERHCRAAREIAEEYFDARKVLSKLLDDAFSSARFESCETRE